MAEDPSGVSSHIGKVPCTSSGFCAGGMLLKNDVIFRDAWDNLYPMYNSLKSSQLGGIDSYEQVRTSRRCCFHLMCNWVCLKLDLIKLYGLCLFPIDKRFQHVVMAARMIV